MSEKKKKSFLKQKSAWWAVTERPRGEGHCQSHMREAQLNFQVIFDLRASHNINHSLLPQPGEYLAQTYAPPGDQNLGHSLTEDAACCKLTGELCNQS